MTSLTKNLKPKSQIFFFITDVKACRIFWGFVWTALWCNHRWRYSRAKTCANCWIL